jgi:nucleoside 2-deoxyribosyltransferase
MLEIYHAAELFNGPNTRFNAEITEGLEKMGYEVFSPQRDGFEFIELEKTLSLYLPPEKIEDASRKIIYSWDMRRISISDVVIARVDEPQDPGVIHEIDIAGALGVPVISYRTDVRSPYGNVLDTFGGMHTFPIESSVALIRVFMSSKTLVEAKQDMKKLIVALHDELSKIINNRDPNTQVRTDYIQKVLAVGDILFTGIDDIHSSEGMQEIAQRYVEFSEILEIFGPRVFLK